MKLISPPSARRVVRCIHQTWKDQNPPDPPFRRVWQESWSAMNPGWDHRFWTDEDMARFVMRRFPAFFPVWNDYPLAIMRVDAWRYLALKQYGGLYADLDFACLHPLDEWLPSTQNFCLAEQGDGFLGNALMWAPHPELPFLDEIEVSLRLSAPEESVLDATGPRFLTAYAVGKEDNLTRLVPFQVYPVAFWRKQELELISKWSLSEIRTAFPEAKSVTFWTNSWGAG